VFSHLAIVFTQHGDNGELTPIGWTVAVVYVVGALFCARAGIVSHQEADRHPDNQAPWSILAIVLLFLGINKKLDLQSLLIHAGHASARADGWDQYRWLAQAVFVVLFTLAVFAALAACVKKWRRFANDQPLILTGVLLLVLFVVVRASTISHVSERFHIRFYDEYWGWILELLATACFAWSAAHAKAK